MCTIVHMCCTFVQKAVNDHGLYKIRYVIHLVYYMVKDCAPIQDRLYWLLEPNEEEKECEPKEPDQTTEQKTPQETPAKQFGNTQEESSEMKAMTSICLYQC